MHAIYFHVAVQIHFNGAAHWVTSHLVDTDIQLYDSLATDSLTPCLEEQIARIYKEFAIHRKVMVSRVPVQQQRNGSDCGVFSIAFAYHAVAGDNLSKLIFDQDRMRAHLVSCFSDQKLAPFPQLHGTKAKTCRLKHIFVHLYCTCLLPESFDHSMVKCDKCKSWFHYKCVNIKYAPRSKWFCSNCK